MTGRIRDILILNHVEQKAETQRPGVTSKWRLPMRRDVAIVICAKLRWSEGQQTRKRVEFNDRSRLGQVLSCNIKAKVGGRSEKTSI